ncbi:MAG: hypothetical protein KF764_32835 [Labilithrix sp.]|nr:hypothetical protein [Labilithrix sp.]MBX3220367.1 hypothetical protein [Labilithrix sp.]
MAQSQPDPDLPGMIDSADDGDRPSITEVNGTVAHFEMAYNPNPSDRFVFGPPLWQRLPSLLFLGFAAVVGGATLLAHTGSSNASLYQFIVAENRTPLVFVIVFAAVATFIRSGLRGVVVTREGVETRTLSMGFPRVRKFRWAQIDRVVLDKDEVLFELWNGTYERLPKVSDGEKMVDLLERIAVGRGRQVTRLDRKR